MNCVLVMGGEMLCGVQVKWRFLFVLLGATVLTKIAWVLGSKRLRAWLGMSENWFLFLYGLFTFWLLVLGGVKCVWECCLSVVFVVWGRRKLVCFVDLCDVNVETVCMLYRTGVLSYRVLIIRYHPMSTKHDGEMKPVKRYFKH